MSFAHSLSDKATVSRFFQQTTFGPTLDMINSWNYGTNGTNTTMNAMASWVESQIGTTPITYHREYFRARVDGPQNQNLPSAKIYGPRHPCDENSSWTRMAFREEDFNIAIESNDKEYVTKATEVIKKRIYIYRGLSELTSR